MMMQHIIPLVASFFSGNMATYFFVPVLCLAGLATIPCILRHFFRLR